jgi:hypothetical protein
MYVFHESIRVTPLPSILLMHCSQRTILRILYVVPSNEVLIRRWVKGRQPVLNLLLQLVTYRIPSVSATKGGEREQMFHLVHFV